MRDVISYNPEDKRSVSRKRKAKKFSSKLSNWENRINPYGIVFLCLVATILQTVLYRIFPNIAYPRSVFEIFGFYEQSFVVQYFISIFISILGLIFVAYLIVLIIFTVWTLIEVGIILYLTISTFVVAPIIVLINGFCNVFGIDKEISINIIEDNIMVDIFELIKDLTGLLFDIPWVFRIMLLGICSLPIGGLGWVFYQMIFM